MCVFMIFDCVSIWYLPLHCLISILLVTNVLNVIVENVVSLCSS